MSQSAHFERSLAVAVVVLLSALALAVVPRAEAASLPDGRAYELVTTGTGGARLSLVGATEVPVSGDTFTFGTNDTPSTSPSSPLQSEWIATRTATGWQDVNTAPQFSLPEASSTATLPELEAADGQQVVYDTDQPLTPGAPDGDNLYLRAADGSFTLLTPHADQNLGSGAPTFSATLAGASGDFTHLFFEPNAALLTSDPVGSGNLYQWASGQLSIVNVMPDGSPGQSGATIPYVGNASLPAVSQDGSDVLFQESSDSADLYLRDDGTRTADVSAPHGLPADPNASVTDEGITPSGSEVLFTDNAKLTSDANTGAPAGQSGPGADLYEYDVATGSLTDLTPDAADSDGADVQSVLASADDASEIYFVAQGVLAPGARSGQDNLYVDREGSIALIATSGSLGYDAYGTPDGQHLAFESSSPLTGYDNTDVATGQPDQEVFEYDALDGSLVCVSCRASGAPPTGSASLASQELPPARELSDDGSRVFFDSDDAVVPAAANGLENVYEYENGVASLISAGNGDTASYLIGATPSGDDVFFTTHDDLTPPANASGQPAIYDARVGGGFAAATSVGPVCPSGCRGAAPAAPSAPLVATATFNGPGNETHRRVAHVTVGRRRVTGSRIAIRVAIPAAGRLVVSGRDLERVERAFTRARTTDITVRLTAGARRALARVRRLRITVGLRYAPRTGGSASTTVHLTVEREVRR